MQLNPLGVAALAVTHSLGSGADLLWHSVIHKTPGLRKNALDWCDLDCWIGQSPEVDHSPLPQALQRWDCRNHRLAWLALQSVEFRRQIDKQVARFGATRVGLVMGTSTSGMRSTEAAYVERMTRGAWPEHFSFQHTHSVDALCRFVSEVLAIQGPSVGIASACASSAKVFLTAQRWIALGLVDAVVVGGADSLCLSTLHGFNALQLLSDEKCRPFDVSRKGISIGEAAGFVLLTREPSDVQLVGGGESSDAFHITSPRPDGLGARLAIEAALKMSSLTPADIDYINAHGTATHSNDQAEACALTEVFAGYDSPISSTKGITGHTLGAAGIIEAIITIKALETQTLPPLADFVQPDIGVNLNLIKDARPAFIRYAMSNNFGFGGANCSLIFGLSA
jgi:3-oxoacyl-[acyl-carrier-protein] synthase-1